MKRKVMTVFYLIDTSGCVKNERLTALNYSIEEGIKLLKELSKTHENTDTRVAIISFNSGSEWISNGAESVYTYKHQWVESGGLCDFGSALNLLNKDMDSILGVYGDKEGQDYKPVFLLMMFGYPTDNYMDALQSLNKNIWCKKGIKIAYAIDDKNDRPNDALIEFTGNEETIVSVTDLDWFRRLFGFYEIPEKDRIHSI